MLRNSVGAVDANCGTPTDRGGWMKPIFALLASGPIYIERWTRPVTRWFPALSETRCRCCQAHLPESLTVAQLSSSTSRQRRWESGVSESDRGAQGNSRTRPALPCRPVRYLSNIVEQDHRAIKRRVRAMQGFRSFHSAWRTIRGIETVNMIRKGQIRCKRTASTV